MFSQIVPLVLLLATISNATLTCDYCNNYEMGKECSRGHLESKTCSGRESLCETRWQNGNDLTWSGCSGEQGMPAEAMECDKVNCKVQCTNYGKQNMRCFCTSEGCNSKATYPQGCKIFASGAGRNDGITVLALFTIWTVLAFCRQ